MAASSSLKNKKKRKIHKTMSEFKNGELHSGSKEGPIVKSHRQAVAIALSQARHVKETVLNVINDMSIITESDDDNLYYGGGRGDKVPNPKIEPLMWASNSYGEHMNKMDKIGHLAIVNSVVPRNISPDKKEKIIGSLTDLANTITDKLNKSTEDPTKSGEDKLIDSTYQLSILHHTMKHISDNHPAFNPVYGERDFTGGYHEDSPMYEVSNHFRHAEQVSDALKRAAPLLHASAIAIGNDIGRSIVVKSTPSDFRP